MLNWLKKRAANQKVAPERDARWGDYEGKGIWFICPDCDTSHEVTDADFLVKISSACTNIGATTQQVYDAFEFQEPGGRWDVDPEKARFYKTTANGRCASGAYAVIGSWNENTHSWLWSWEMDDEWMPGPAKSAAHKMKELGDKKGWEITAARHLLLNENETWHVANLAAEAAGFPATYRAKVNDINHHYYIIDQLQWETIQ